MRKVLLCLLCSSFLFHIYIQKLSAQGNKEYEVRYGYPIQEFPKHNRDYSYVYSTRGFRTNYPLYNPKLFWIGKNGRTAPSFIFPNYGSTYDQNDHWCRRTGEFFVNYEKEEVYELTIDPQKYPSGSIGFKIFAKSHVYNADCSKPEEGVKYYLLQFFTIYFEQPYWISSTQSLKKICPGTDRTYNLKDYFSIKNNVYFYLDQKPTEENNHPIGNNFNPKDLTPGKHTIYAVKTYDNGIADKDYGSKRGEVFFPFEFEILSNPDVNISSHAATICNNSIPFQFKATPEGGIWTGQGIISDGMFDPSQASLGENTLTYTITHPSGCIAKKEAHIRVNEASAIHIANYPSSFCKNASPFQFKAIPEGGNWSGQGIDQYGIFSPRNAPLQASKLAYSYRRADNGCVSEQEIPIEVKDAYDISITSHDPTICSNAYPLQLMANPRGGTWSGSSISATGVLNSSKVPLGDNKLTYSITHPSGCISKESTHIRVLEASVIDLATYPKAFCSNGLPFQFKAIPEGGNWSGQGINQHGLFNPRAAASYQSNLFYSYVRKDNSCKSEKIFPIDVRPIPDELTVSGHNEGCQGDILKLSVQPKTGQYKNLTYHWVRTNTHAEYKRGEQIDHIIEKNERLTSMATNDIGCLSTNSAHIDIKDFTPRASIEASSTEGKQGDRILLSAKVEDSQNEHVSEYQYAWKLSNGLTFHSKEWAQYFYQLGKMGVNLTVTSPSKYGCQAKINQPNYLTIHPANPVSPDIGGEKWEHFELPKNERLAWVLYPSPFTDWLKVRVTLRKEQEVKFYIIDTGPGQLHYSFKFQGQRGENNFLIQNLNLGLGTYYGIIHCDDLREDGKNPWSQGIIRGTQPNPDP